MRNLGARVSQRLGGIRRAAATRLDLAAASHSPDTLNSLVVRSSVRGRLVGWGCTLMCNHTVVSKGAWEKGGTPDYKGTRP